MLFLYKVVSVFIYITMEAIEKKFIRTGVVNLSEFFKVNREKNNETCTFDMIPSTSIERHRVEKDKEAITEAWIASVLI